MGGFRTQSIRRYEVWVSNNPIEAEDPGGLRFNAGFQTVTEALDECEWYHQHGYRACVMDNRAAGYIGWEEEDNQWLKSWWKSFNRAKIK